MADSSSEDCSLGQKIDLADTRRFVVRDRWNGLGQPRDVSLDLARDESGAFEGETREVIGSWLTLDLSQPVEDVQSMPMRIAPRSAKHLFRSLAKARMVPGAYTPRFEWTDDIPHIEIVITTGARSVALFSESQGEFHAPWGARIGRKQYTLPGDDIGQVLKRLRKLVPARRAAAPAGVYVFGGKS